MTTSNFAGKAGLPNLPAYCPLHDKGYSARNQIDLLQVDRRISALYVQSTTQLYCSLLLMEKRQNLHIKGQVAWKLRASSIFVGSFFTQICSKVLDVQTSFLVWIDRAIFCEKICISPLPTKPNNPSLKVPVSYLMNRFTVLIWRTREISKLSSPTSFFL